MLETAKEEEKKKKKGSKMTGLYFPKGPQQVRPQTRAKSARTWRFRSIHTNRHGADKNVCLHKRAQSAKSICPPSPRQSSTARGLDASGAYGRNKGVQTVTSKRHVSAGRSEPRAARSARTGPFGRLLAEPRKATARTKSHPPESSSHPAPKPSSFRRTKQKKPPR